MALLPMTYDYMVDPVTGVPYMLIPPCMVDGSFVMDSLEIDLPPPLLSKGSSFSTCPSYFPIALKDYGYFPVDESMPIGANILPPLVKRMHSAPSGAILGGGAQRTAKHLRGTLLPTHSINGLLFTMTYADRGICHCILAPFKKTMKSHASAVGALIIFQTAAMPQSLKRRWCEICVDLLMVRQAGHACAVPFDIFTSLYDSSDSV
eukprot:4172888-Amphidinium_carterae.2